MAEKTKREVASLYKFSVENRNFSKKWQHRLGLGETDITKCFHVFSDNFPRKSWSSHLKGKYTKLGQYVLHLNVSKRHSTKCYQMAEAQFEVSNCYSYK